MLAPHADAHDTQVAPHMCTPEGILDMTNTSSSSLSEACVPSGGASDCDDSVRSGQGNSVRSPACSMNSTGQPDPVALSAEAPCAPTLGWIPVQSFTLQRRPPSPLPVHLCKLFVGQIPTCFTEEQVGWALWCVSGSPVEFVERVIRRSRKQRVSGCFHVVCLRSHRTKILRANGRALLDRDGLWTWSTYEEKSALEEYCKRLQAYKAAHQAASVSTPPEAPDALVMDRPHNFITVSEPVRRDGRSSSDESY